jgi:integrase
VRHLEKMTGHTRLYRRGATYYHRAVVPKDIINSYEKREETFSLRTKDRGEALQRVRVEAVRVDKLFAKHRRDQAGIKLTAPKPALSELTIDQIARTKRAYLHHLLDEDEDIRLDGFYDPEDHSAQLFETPRPTFEERQSGIEESDAFTRANLARGKRDVFLRSEAEEVLTWDHIELHLAEASSSWPRLIRALQEATVEAIAIIRKRDVGDSIPTPAYPDSMPNLVDQPTLSTVVTAWEAEKARGAWSVKVRNDYLAWMLLFQQIAGDRPLGNYSKEDARTFKSVLLKLPANWRKKPAIKDLSVLEAIKKAEELGIAPMSTTTLNKAIGRLASFWSWTEAHFDGIRPSLFKGLTIRQTVSVRDQRDPFSPDQLSKLFASPLFLGCISERRCAEPGDLSMHNTARYWLPLMGLLTGARLNELCQLTPANVREEDGTPYLEITNEAEGQRIKSASGKRRIPIHKRLVELGFIEFAAKRQEEQTAQLFPELKMDASGYLSGEFSKFFSRYTPAPELT